MREPLKRLSNKGEFKMTSYDPFVCDFKSEENKARRMTIEELNWSINDASECIRLGINPNRYYDQISVYRKELGKRIKGGK
jgi:hypothetical protein